MKNRICRIIIFIICLFAMYSQQYKSIETDEFVFDALIEGNSDGIPVILLHGFPETAHMWDELQNYLSDEGYYTIAPNQRGYSQGARPHKVKEYIIDKLINDVLAIANELNIDKFHLIGHDWGSAVGWGIAAKYPERLLSWTAMSVPHPGAFSLAIKNDELQFEASSYMRLFQWPLIPELFLKANNFKNLIAIWEKTSESKIELYLSVLNSYGALRGAINWYRANYNALLKGTMDFTEVNVPTLFIWGEKDPAILKSGAIINKNYVRGKYREEFINAGHWLIEEKFNEIAPMILEHLSQ